MYSVENSNLNAGGSLRPAWASEPGPRQPKNPKQQTAKQWWHIPLISPLGRQRQVNLGVQGQPGLQGEFKDSPGYTETLSGGGRGACKEATAV